MLSNVVVALGSEDTLPGILTQVHQAGLGANALVLRPRRTSIQRQLERHGIPTGQMPARVDSAEIALVIYAAGRAQIAADITRQHGASATWIVGPSATWDLVDDDIVTQSSPKLSTPVVLPAASLGAIPDETSDI
jgi:hypothetical protein